MGVPLNHPSHDHGLVLKQPQCHLAFPPKTFGRLQHLPCQWVTRCLWAATPAPSNSSDGHSSGPNRRCAPSSASAVGSPFLGFCQHIDPRVNQHSRGVYRTRNHIVIGVPHLFVTLGYPSKNRGSTDHKHGKR